MGYTHYWQQRRAFTSAEWNLILGEAKRIIAKAARGEYYSGRENAASQDNVTVDEQGFRHGFNEEGTWRTFPHPEVSIPQQGEPILLAGPDGRNKPRLTKNVISLNGKRPDGYESFALEKKPTASVVNQRESGLLFGFCKTEYRKYDAVVVSILHVARTVAPDAIVVTSDGGDAAIRYLF